jgi:hypothetical protein
MEKDIGEPRIPDNTFDLGVFYMNLLQLTYSTDYGIQRFNV